MRSKRCSVLYTWGRGTAERLHTLSTLNQEYLIYTRFATHEGSGLPTCLSCSFRPLISPDRWELCLSLISHYIERFVFIREMINLTFRTTYNSNQTKEAAHPVWPIDCPYPDRLPARHFEYPYPDRHLAASSGRPVGMSGCRDLFIRNLSEVYHSIALTKVQYIHR